MSVPILLVTSALGAGKTTLISRLLSEPQGRRLAAIVNDFGAIDIDAAVSRTRTRFTTFVANPSEIPQWPSP